MLPATSHAIPLLALALLLMNLLLVGGCGQSRPESAVGQEPVLGPEVEGRAGVAEIRKLGGRLKVNDQNPLKPIVAVHLPTTPITDAGLACLSKWTELRVLDLSATNVTTQV